MLVKLTVKLKLTDDKTKVDMEKHHKKPSTVGEDFKI